VAEVAGWRTKNGGHVANHWYVSLSLTQWRRFVFRAGGRDAEGVDGGGVYFEILFLKMVHFGAFLYALNKV